MPGIYLICLSIVALHTAGSRIRDIVGLRSMTDGLSHHATLIHSIYGITAIA